MSRVYADSVQPRWDYQDLTLGASGDTIDIAGNIITADVFKDSGGNTLFESNGSGVLSNVSSGLKGNLVFISSQTETDADSISFTSGIDSTYDVYIFKFIEIHPDTNGGLFSFQANVAGGSGFNEALTSTWFHARHTETDSVAQLSYGASYDQALGTAYQGLSYDGQNNADDCLCGNLIVFNPSSTTYVKNWYCEVNEVIRNGTGGSSNNFVAGYFNTASAIDEFSFKMSSGTLDGTIKLYGLL